MSGIPADIEQTAFTAAGSWHYDPFARQDLANDIARLIIAERERCLDRCRNCRLEALAEMAEEARKLGLE